MTLLALLLGCARIASAHHGFALEFDAKAPRLLTGKVTEVQLINPLAWITMEVAKDGKKQLWNVECGSPNGLVRAGVTKDILKSNACKNK